MPGGSAIQFACSVWPIIGGSAFYDSDVTVWLVLFDSSTTAAVLHLCCVCLPLGIVSVFFRALLLLALSSLLSLPLSFLALCCVLHPCVLFIRSRFPCLLLLALLFVGCSAYDVCIRLCALRLVLFCE